MKTAGVDESIWVFEGTAQIFESQDEACEGILGGKVRDGDVVVIRYEGAPRGGPGDAGNALSNVVHQVHGAGQNLCAADRRPLFPAAPPGCRLATSRQRQPRAEHWPCWGTGDRIRIDIPKRKIDVLIADAELSARRQKINAYRPRNRQRHIPQSLQAYAALTTSCSARSRARRGPTTEIGRPTRRGEPAGCPTTTKGIP